ncbi:MAG: hypothetical protein JW952_08180 [Candidatus Eisenbacteria bacterium]|nr:hypothetical protein [Candidatus Eisenbacteria bacterium]
MRIVFLKTLLVLSLIPATAVALQAGPVHAQSSPDGLPPAPVRDLRVGGGSRAVYSRGFFIPTPFTITDSVAAILNQKFDVLTVGPEANQSLIDPSKVMLVAGPGMTYSNSVAMPDDWAVIDSHEDWFLHSSPVPSSGTRIPLSSPYPHLYYMDVASQGWRDFVVGRYAASLSATPAADGVFLDGVMLPAEYENLLGSAYPGYDADTYQSHGLDFIYAVKDAAAGKLVVVNSELSKAFTLAADGALAEGFVHFGGRRNDEQIPEYQWLKHLALIGDRDFDGRLLLVGSGSLDSTLASMVEYCYASFLLGYNQHTRSCFYWHSNADGGYSKVNWFPVWEMDIGDPVGGYYESDGVYRREFTGGTVVVNPNDSGAPVTLNLDGAYVDCSGNMVSFLTLPNKTGAVLRSLH